MTMKVTRIYLRLLMVQYAMSIPTGTCVTTIISDDQIRDRIVENEYQRRYVKDSFEQQVREALKLEEGGSCEGH